MFFKALFVSSALVHADTPITNSLGMELVSIPAGTFIMGSPKDEKGHRADETQREVTLTQKFRIATTEVTQKQWKDLMGTNFQDLINQQEGPLGRGAKLKSTPSAIANNQPMCFVNWSDAIAFCKKLTEQERVKKIISNTAQYTLPTEAQWEFCCRAGTNTTFTYGNSLTSKEANFYGKLPYGTDTPGIYREKSTPIKSFPPNAWGLFDMHGNLYEWCLDWYEERPNSKTDPTGPNSGDGRIIRGGAWDRKGSSCRSAYRYSRDPVRRSHNIGFRVILIEAMK